MPWYGKSCRPPLLMQCTCQFLFEYITQPIMNHEDNTSEPAEEAWRIQLAIIEEPSNSYPKAVRRTFTRNAIYMVLSAESLRHLSGGVISKISHISRVVLVASLAMKISISSYVIHHRKTSRFFAVYLFVSSTVRLLCCFSIYLHAASSFGSQPVQIWHATVLVPLLICRSSATHLK